MYNKTETQQKTLIILYFEIHDHKKLKFYEIVSFLNIVFLFITF